MNFFPRLARNDDAVSEPPDDGSVDGDSVASESSSEASKSPEEGDKITIPPPLDFSQPWVDVYILEFVDPSLFMVRTQKLFYDNPAFFNGMIRHDNSVAL